MRFKISQQHPTRHKKMVTCVAWSASDEIFSCGDDHQLMCWKFEGGVLNSKVVVEFPEDFYPTDMQWHPRPSQPGIGAIKKQSMEVLLITTDDGKFHLVNRSGRIEKSVAAHGSATLSGKWSYDGSALYTAGEDGQVKVWSRSGMLRSTVIRGNQPVYASAWSPDNTAILYSQGPYLYIQSLTTSSKPNKWHAHDGLVLVASWNQFHGLIISGGEDCRHKVWDANGSLLYASVSGDQPITALSWCFSGSYFAVGSFDTLKLCDKTGWSHSLEKIQAGSIYDIAWSSDGTQVALACSNGSVLIAHTIEKKLEYNGYEATLVKRKTIRVSELGTDVNETLDIADRVIQLEFGFEHLVVVTPNQCHIYAVTNWNTPAIFDLKNGSVSAVLLAEKHFLLVEWNAVSLYTYQGRSLGSPKWKGISSEPLYPPCISICSDTLAVRSQNNYKLIHILEVSPKKPISEGQPYTHVQDVITLALNHVGGANDRQLALIDNNRDLFLVSIRSSGFGRVCKIAAMAQNIAWATDANVLAGMLDSTLSVWLCPNCVHYSDRKIIRKTRVDKESSEFGKHPTIVKVQNGLVTVRRGDGALVVSSFYTFFTNLHNYVLNGKWEDAVSLCRIVQNETLWTCLAVMAIDSKQLNIAEEACAAIGRYDKVDYIRYIKKIPNEVEMLAETCALMGDLQAAEGVLLQNGRVQEAIRLNITTYRWSRALELALKHRKLLEEVLEARKRYLEVIGKNESNSDFLALRSGTAAAKKEAREKEREAREKEREERAREKEEREREERMKENEARKEEIREMEERERRKEIEERQARIENEERERKLKIAERQEQLEREEKERKDERILKAEKRNDKEEKLEDGKDVRKEKEPKKEKRAKSEEKEVKVEKERKRKEKRDGEEGRETRAEKEKRRLEKREKMADKEGKIPKEKKKVERKDKTAEGDEHQKEKEQKKLVRKKERTEKEKERLREKKKERLRKQGSENSVENRKSSTPDT